jgi:hypothetical protein
MPEQAWQPSGVHEDRLLAGPDLATLNRGGETGERLRRVHGIKNEPLAVRGVIERAACAIGQLLVSRANLTLVETQSDVPWRPRSPHARELLRHCCDPCWRVQNSAGVDSQYAFRPQARDEPGHRRPEPTATTTCSAPGACSSSPVAHAR